MDEPSVPSYIQRSFRKGVRSPWSFSWLGPAWPEATRSRQERWPDPRVTDARGTEPTTANYQAQHPSLYYAIAGRILGLFPARGQLDELLALRLASALLGSLSVFAAAISGGRFYGRAGVLAGALLGICPTWMALVGRAGNDALAVAAVAAGVVFSTRSRATPLSVAAEAALWTVAIATKATAWPLLVIVAVSARVQRWPLWRLLSVGVSFFLTVLDLRARTGSLPGDQGFASGSSVPSTTPGSAALPDFEGWYLWTLGPLLFPSLLGWAFWRARRIRAVPILFVVWLVGWDVRIHEGALIRDYAGETSPRTPSRLFRRGPSGNVDTDRDRLGLRSAGGVSASTRHALRGVSVVSLAALTAISLRRRRGAASLPVP